MDNGHSKALTNPKDGSRVWTLTVSKDFDAIAVQVGGEMPNIDEGIAMLKQALVAMELRQRQAQAIEMQQALAEAARTATIVNSVRGGRG